MALNVELLESSFQAVAPKADELANTFYDQLFTDYPAVKPLFANTDLAEQKKHLIAALSTVVGNLRKPDALTKVLGELGVRHIGYGAERAHYPAVGQTLLTALAKVAGDAWTTEMNDAWTEAYGAIQGIIYQALDDHEKSSNAA